MYACKHYFIKETALIITYTGINLEKKEKKKKLNKNIADLPKIQTIFLF